VGSKALDQVYSSRVEYIHTAVSLRGHGLINGEVMRLRSDVQDDLELDLIVYNQRSR
jgi:hypothetical protein